MNAIMTIRNTIQKGEVRTNKTGDRYIFMWNETQYCFPKEVWDIIKEYWGFIPNFPANFGSMYSRYADMNKSGKVSDFDLRSVNMSIKRELGNLYYPNWLKESKTAFLANGDCGDHYIYPIEIENWLKHNQLKFWLKRRENEIINFIYSRISQPFSFLHCDLKVGDKILLNVALRSGDPLLFKQGGDKDNVVPTEDIEDYTISHNSKATGKSVFNPRYKTTQGGRNSYYDYVPAIITSVSAIKIKLDYYKYNIIEETRHNNTYADSVVYSADWSAPRGKIVCGWGQRMRVIGDYDKKVRSGNIDTITQDRETP